MGMSASQARLLSLQARQSNLEYQGQQINQERTILSQQATALYNSLLSMTVPTPPATTDYQTIQYSGELGATKYTFDANSVKPYKDDTYTVILGQEAYGDSLSKDSSIAVVDSNAGGAIRGQTITELTTTEGNGTFHTATGSETPTAYMVPYTGDSFNGKYVQDGDKWRAATQDDLDKGTQLYSYTKTSTSEKAIPVVENTDTVGKPISEADFQNLYVINSDGSVTKATTSDVTGDGSSSNPYRYKKEGTQYFIEKSNGGETKNAQGAIGGTINGKNFFELNDEQKVKYAKAIEQSGLRNGNGEPYTVEDFYIYFDDEGSAHFALKSDVDDGNNNAITYSYEANGQYTKNQSFNDVKLTFDPTNGRITQISIPTYETITNEDGTITTNYDKVTSYTTIDVSAETVTDDAAYKDAYAQYEYDTYLYDQKNKEINAKTEVIQQEDKNLELKLQRLDNERTQITTEIEAVDKVINDNIEASYKTFSG